MADLLHARCDPYGIESTVRLFGGVYPENMMGKHVWYCPERAEARFVFVCRGGEYGFKRANDSGILAAYQCAGGHKGPPMPLCRKHQKELGTTGYQDPVPLNTPQIDGAGRAQQWAPGSVVGGSKANECCPACAMPPEAKALNETAGRLAGMIGQAESFGLFTESARLKQELEPVQYRLNELHESGRVHKCPLKLLEVS